MMNKTLLVITVSLFCFFEKAASQDLHIYYDVETSLVKYVYDGEEIKRPKIKKDGNIFLHVQNYNNYLYSLEVESNDQLLQIPSGSGLGFLPLPEGTGGNLISGGRNFSSGAGDGYINIVSGGNKGRDVGENDEEEGMGFVVPEEYEETASEGAQSEEFQALYAEYESILNDMVLKEGEFTKIQNEVSGIEKNREFRNIGLSEIQKIKWNPEFSPNQVKRMSNQFLYKILEIKDTSQLTLDNVIQKGDDRKQLEKQLNQLEKSREDYEINVNNLNDFSERLKGLQMNFEEFYLMQSHVGEIYQKALGVQESIKSQKETIDQMYQSFGKTELQKMTSLWYEYEALKSNDFSYTYRTEATGDRTVLGIKFSAKDSLGRELPINKKQLAPIRVPVYGGMKINVSVGISFASFFDQPQSYFLRDTVILSEDVDAFIPVITSFFHFYPQSAGNVSIGGNFGIGFPLSNSDGGQSLSFFLGPSFVIGKGQRIVLSTGIKGGRVEQLSQGLKTGDVLPPFSSIPTKNVYKLGYFLGISFNLGGG